MEKITSLFIVNTLGQAGTDVQQAIEGLTASAAESHIVHTAGMSLSPCVGCNACWLKTPGICGIHDGYEEILKGYLKHDATVFLSGTALGFVDHRMKNVVDRMLPLATMFIKIQDGQVRHTARYDKSMSFGLLYAGEADGQYMGRWWDRVCLNFSLNSLGALPLERWKEMGR